MRNFVLIIILCSVAIYLTAQQEIAETSGESVKLKKSSLNEENILEAELDITGAAEDSQNQTNNSDPEAPNEVSSQDCIFDLETQTDEFLRSVPEFVDYSWDDISKTATILLPAGDTLYATRGGCDHFAFTGTLVKSGSSHAIDDVSHWLEQGAWISKRVFSADDFTNYMNMVENKDYEVTVRDNSLFILFNNSQYGEWSLTVRLEADENKTIIETGYYIN